MVTDRVDELAARREPEAIGAPEQARVAVVIPTYNRARWLGGAIESVLAQTSPDFTLVVSDNASTDTTPDVVAAFGDPRLSYVRLERHLGLNEHFNLCLERAATDYVFLLPDDDRIAPELLETTVSVLDGNPRVGLVHGQVDVVDEHGSVIAAAHEMTGLTRDAVESGEEFIRRSMSMSFRVHASTALIRREAVSSLRLDERDFPATDLALWLRVALDWDIAFVARPLATYRIHTGAYSAGAADVTVGGYIQGVERILKIREAKLRFLSEHGERGVHGLLLRACAKRAFRRELLDQAAHATFPDRRLGPTARTLAECARLDGAVVLEPAAWRLLVASILGPRAVAFVKRVLGRPRASARAAA